MKLVIAFTVFAGFALGCGGKDTTKGGGTEPTSISTSGSTEDDLKSLAGNWQVADVKAPKPQDEKELVEIKSLEVTITGNVLKLVERKEKPEFFLIRLNSGRSPKEVDLVPADEAGKPKIEKGFTTSSKGGGPYEREASAVPGIFTLTGDTLTVAFSDREEYRPKEFRPAIVENTGPFVTVNRRASSEVYVIELKRVK